MRSKSMLLSTLAAALLMLPGCPTTTTTTVPTPTTTKVHQLEVRRHTSTSLSNACADQVLADMGTVARNIDGPGDVPADVRFERLGDVTTFTTGTGHINGPQDFYAVNNLPGNVKVVNRIDWCGGIAIDSLGCAPVEGTSLIVRRHDNAEGILWLHEFGHNKGRCHRCDDTAVMNKYITPTHRDLNQDEATAIEN